MNKIRRTIACAVGLLSFAGLAHAVPQMLLPATATKAAKLPPGDIKSGATAVAFNAAELQSLRIGDEVELALPNGTRHTFVFDQKITHPQGDVTWIGYYRDRDQRLKLNAIVTTGVNGSMGTIQTPDGDYTLSLGNAGEEWLVDAKAERALSPALDMARDAKFVPKALKEIAEKKGHLLAQPDFAEVVPGVTVGFSTTIPDINKVAVQPPIVFVDMLIAYNDSVVAGIGGAANVSTWANSMIDQANQIFDNSKVGIHLRLAGTMLLSYSDTAGNNAVLNDITGVSIDQFGNFAFITTAAHTALENKRVQVGADMVTLIRGGNGITAGRNFGAGVAWIAQGPIDASWAPFTYSTVIGCYLDCQYIWTHEVGHNMGNMHDRATAQWEAGDPNVNPGDPNADPGTGSYDYSWGFYSCNGRYDNAVLTCPAFAPGAGCTNPDFNTGKPNCSGPNTNGTANYRDLMAYFHESTTLVLQFSNPDLKCATSNFNCGLNAGSTDPQMTNRPTSANTALSMNNNAAALSALRASVLPSSPVTAMLSATSNPTRVGNAVTLTATLSSSGGTPTGTVAFSSNSGTIAGCGAVAVSAGTAQCTTSYASPGTYTLAAQFVGSGLFANATSNAISEIVGVVPSMIGGMPRKLSFDGNATTDLGWMGPGVTPGAWLMNGLAFTPSVVNSALANGVLRTYGDFNKDGKTDLLWRGPDGAYAISFMNGTSVTGNAGVLPGGLAWDVIGVGDFNGDGIPDLLWSGADGSFGIWLMDGVTGSGASSPLVPPAPGMVPYLLGDFNGDLKTDILWMNSAGAVTVALMNGAAASTTTGSVVQVLGPGTGWRPTGLADLNGDGKADIFWLANDGTTGAWLMNGTSATPGALLGANSGWRVVASTDLDGDGKMDVVWQNPTTGEAAVWLMNGLAPKPGGQAYIYNGADPRWAIVGVGDFNGDGKGDLLWKHTSGSYGFWLMNGATQLNVGILLGDGTGWSVVAP